MYNADPKSFPKAEKLDAISYKDAIELSYYGASVIHPKTIQPLQNKEIPLYVKSFLDPSLPGTAIKKDAFNTIPCYIIKDKQVLVSLSTKNFSFIAEKNLAEIFNKYDQLDMKINIMQNSAVNFSALFDEKQFQESKVLEAFQSSYAVRYNENVELITIRHYNSAIIEELTAGREILLEQRTRETVRFVVR
jgi:aspartate kinase